MGMSASQARLLSLTARMSDLEFQAQSISNSKIRLADESAQASRKYSAALDKKIMKVANGKDGTYQDASVTNIALYGTAQNLNSTTNKFRYIEDSAGKLVMTQAQRDLLAGNNNGNVFPLQLPNSVANNIPRVKNADGTPGIAYDENSAAYKYYKDIYAKVSTGQVNIIAPNDAQDPEWLENQIKAGGVFLREYNETGGKLGTGSFDQVSWMSGDDSMHEEDDKSQIARAEAEYETTMADIQSKDKRFDLQLKTIDTEHTAIQTEIDSVKKVIDKNIERSFKIFNA